MNDFNNESCRACEDICKNTHANPCDDCDALKKTRAEQIQAMTDTELASFLERIYQDGRSGTRPSCNWLEWLRQKAED